MPVLLLEQSQPSFKSDLVITCTTGHEETVSQEQRPDAGRARVQLNSNQQGPGDRQDILDNNGMPYVAPSRTTGDGNYTIHEAGTVAESGSMHGTVSPLGHPGKAPTPSSILLQNEYESIIDSRQEPQTCPSMVYTNSQNIGEMQKIKANIDRLDQHTQALQQALRDSQRSKEELESYHLWAPILANTAPTEPSISLVATTNPQVTFWESGRDVMNDVMEIDYTL